jgi:hypothetical protein
MSEGRPPADLEGLPWPQGDPGALRGAAGRASSVASELDSEAGGLLNLADPLGWYGAAQSSFAGSVGRHSDTMSSAAGAFRQAASALNKLAGIVEHAQDRVTQAAKKLHDARTAAAQANSLAQGARQVATHARQAADNAEPLPGMAGITGTSPLEAHAQQAEQTATNMETNASIAQGHAQDVQTWAISAARDAVHDVESGDRSTASEIESLGLAGTAPPGSPSASIAGGSLAGLGRYVFGSHGDSNRSFLGWLSAPPPPPPPPPPPKKEHHNGLLAGGLFVATGLLTVVDAVQLGADPLTDGATVAVGGAAVEEAGIGATEVAADGAAEEAATAAGAAAEGTEGAAAASEAATTDSVTAADTPAALDQGEAGETWHPEDGTPVIGRLPDTDVAKPWPGHSVLDLKDWSIAKNDRWIQSIIDQRGTVYTGSPEAGNTWDLVYDRPTVYGRELDMLRQAGYTKVGDYMVPPGG